MQLDTFLMQPPVLLFINGVEIGAVDTDSTRTPLRTGDPLYVTLHEVSPENIAYLQDLVFSAHEPLPIRLGTWDGKAYLCRVVTGDHPIDTIPAIHIGLQVV